MRPLLALLVAFVVCGSAAATAHAAGAPLIPREPPASGKVPGFAVDRDRAVAVATATGDVQTETGRANGPPLVAMAFLFGDEYWLVDFFRGDHKRVEVQLNGRTGKLVGSWVGREIDWPPLAHGAHGPDARRLHKLLVLLGLLFLLPFVDARRPLRMLHLDLLVLLSFGVSHLFAAKGDIYASTPLFYVPLLYLLGRLGFIAFRRIPGPSVSERVTWMPSSVLLGGLIGLLALRYGYDVAYGSVNDVGYASVVGGDSIINGYPLYDSAAASGHLDSYGPITYLAYAPFDLIFGFDLRHGDTQAPMAAAMAFDFLTVVGLYVVGRRMRAGAAGRQFGLALGWAFAAFPWTMFVLSASTNDGLVSLLLVWTLVVVASPGGRGLGLALSALTKFAPLILVPVFLRGAGDRERRSFVAYAGAFAVTSAVVVLAYLPDGGLREFYDSTIGFQFARTSPLSIWGLHESLMPLHTVVTVIGVTLAIASVFLPRRRDVPTLAATAAALLVMSQIVAKYWYFFYLCWFLPYALVALFSRSYAGSVRNSGSSSASAVASNNS